MTTPTPTAEIMNSYMSQLVITYNNMDFPIGCGGHIIANYPDWLEDCTLWKVNLRNKPFRIRRPEQVYYELAKASYLELTHQAEEMLPDWTSHQLKCFNQSIRHITSKRLNKIMEEERKIKKANEDDEEEYDYDDFQFDEMIDFTDVLAAYVDDV